MPRGRSMSSRQRRNRRASVADLWNRRDGTPTQAHGQGSRWAALWVEPNGKQRQKKFRLKRDAEAFVTELNAAMVTGTYITPGAGRVSIADVYEAWSKVQAHIAAKTEATRRSAWNYRVKPQWGDTLVSDVTTSAVQAWVATMVADKAGVTTIENAFGLLRQVLGAAVTDARIPRNPCEGVKLPKRKHADRGYLTHRQVAALAAAVEFRPEAVRFLAYTGLRWGEMAALRVQDFEMLRRRVNISRNVVEVGGLDWKQPKTHERRSVPFPASLENELAALMSGKGRDDLVFTDARGGVLRNSNYRPRIFAPAVAKCQDDDETFPKITPHDLRHTAASLAVSAGANVMAVQRMLGHKKASMTLDTYADLFDSDLDAVAEGLDAGIRTAATDLLPMRA